MRALVILVLAGGLLWLALQGFRSVRAGSESQAGPPPAGYLLPPRDPKTVPDTAGQPENRPETERSGGSEPRGEAMAGSEAPPEPPSLAVVPSAPAVAPEPPEKTKSPPPSTSESAPVSPDEVGLASLILYRPREVPNFLTGPGSSLPPGRKQLALGLHHLVLGAEAEARRIAADLETGEAVRAEESGFLRRALSSDASDPLTVDSKESPMIVAASLARLSRIAHDHLAGGRNREAAIAYGELLLGTLDAPWSPERESLQEWSDALGRAQSGYRWSPGPDWPSISMKVEPGDSLISVRKRALDSHPGLLVCTGQIRRANGLRGGIIHPGDILKIPTAHADVLIDLDSHWALYRMDFEVVGAWEIGVGKPGSETPPGEYRAGEKTEKPMWFRPGHPPVPFGDPENPLGTRWIAWQRPDGTNTGLGFHGTRDPGSIGEDQSQGCIRMRKEAIEELFEILPRGAVILVRG